MQFLSLVDILTTTVRRYGKPSCVDNQQYISNRPPSPSFRFTYFLASYIHLHIFVILTVHNILGVNTISSRDYPVI